MLIYEYPAKMTYEDDVYLVDFPDLKYCSTYGETREEAIMMANDALALCVLEDGSRDIPTPSKPESIAAAENEEVVLIKANTTLYREKYFDTKPEGKQQKTRRHKLQTIKLY